MHHDVFDAPHSAAQSRSSKHGVQGATDKDIGCRGWSGAGGGNVSGRKEQLLEDGVHLFLSPNDGCRPCGRRG